MTNYLVSLATLALVSGAANAADAPAATYKQTAGSSLGFSFTQEGAANQGAFKQFATTLVYDEKNLAASKLDVKITVDSLDTKDGDRDDTLKSEDLFDAAKFPTATYSATSFVKGANGVEAVGKLTIRGITKDLRLPLTIKPTTAGVELSGDVTIKRLDFGVGQGEWKSTSSVADAVKITYKVALAKG